MGLEPGKLPDAELAQIFSTRAGDLGSVEVLPEEAWQALVRQMAPEYHRGAFVERFDADSVLENHELYGVLNGIASARAAANPSPKLLHRLDIALARFARLYADQTEADHAALVKAANRGIVPIEHDL